MPTPDHMVYVIDDDDRVSEALAGLLSAAGFNSTSFISAAEHTCHSRIAGPCCSVVDVELADPSGLDLQGQIVEQSRPPIAFIAGRGNVHSSARVMKAGAINFLTNPFVEKEPPDAIDVTISDDRQDRQNRQNRELREDFSKLDPKMGSLRPREREVMSLVVSGLLNKQADTLLGSSEITLQIYHGKVMKKMQAASPANLARMADTMELPAQLKLNDSDRDWSERDYV